MTPNRPALTMKRFLSPKYHPPKHQRIFWWTAALLTGLALLSVPACSANWLPASNPPPAQALPGMPVASPLPQQPLAEITFRVQAPPNHPADQPVTLTILDEVTGLVLNAQNYSMQAEPPVEGQPSTYSLRLTFAVGSAVKYRYERQTATVRVGEHVSDGSAVRYRLYHVQGPGMVDDVVSRWTDTAFSAPTGRISGHVSDAASGQPLPNILVTAGGAQTLTTSDGSYLLEGLPPGVHNLVAYALDGSYRTFQQGALVAADSTTPAPLTMQIAPQVSLIFVVKLPEDTPPVVPIRLAGSLVQLGNTFASLAGGTNSLTTNMPVLNLLPDDRYTITLSLPAGADVRYKYTLGDGFWNAEHNRDGSFTLRQVIVPEQNALIEDVVETWHAGSNSPISFDVTVPPETPADDFIYLQLNPMFGWMEPIPMWSLGNGRWAYVLYGPLNLPGDLSFRYCRNGQCGSADDIRTAGPQNPGYSVTPVQEAQSVIDQVGAWSNLGASLEPGFDLPAQIAPRPAGFVAGVEFQPTYHPSWRVRLPNSLAQVQNLSANWVFFSPTWSATRNSPPVLEPVAGRDPLWFDLTEAVEQGRALNLNVAIHPQVRFPEGAAEWWQSAPRDFSWWVVWFDHYRTFILHHADLAERTNAPALVLGGEWIAPALPGGTLSDGSDSGVPLDAETRWRDLLAEVRSRYAGRILWALPYTDVQDPPPFLEAVDEIYLLWSPPLAGQPGASLAELQAAAGNLLDLQVQPLQYLAGKPVVLGVTYPSASGGVTGCLPAPEGGCLEAAALAAPNADIPTVELNLHEQVEAYFAVLQAVNGRDWVAGVVTRGYYPPAALQDKSASVHGKPAAELLRHWFSLWLAAP